MIKKLLMKWLNLYPYHDCTELNAVVSSQRTKIEQLQKDLSFYRAEHQKEYRRTRRLIEFLEKASTKRENEDGTVTFTITSFVTDLKNLLHRDTGTY